MIPILLMADYTADPLWHRPPDGKGASMLSLKHLPLNPELTARLRGWASTFDSLMGNDFAWSSPGARAK